jgi:hypothetical protein
VKRTIFTRSASLWPKAIITVSPGLSFSSRPVHSPSSMKVLVERPPRARLTTSTRGSSEHLSTMPQPICG